jgi:DoxX-like family
MESATQTGPVSKKMLWAGVIISALPAILFFVTGVFPFINPAAAAEGTAHMGYPAHLGVVISILEIGCAIIYVIPRTSVLGAVLLTGYLGGATASHIRIGEPPVLPLVVAALVWLGIYLREPRLRSVLPLRK